MKNNKLAILINTLILLVTITSFGFTQSHVSNESRVRQYIVEFWNRSNIEVADKVLASEAVLVSPDGVFEGAEAIKSLHNTYVEAFSDLSFIIENLSINGDKVEVEWVLEGTHDGEILGIAPTWQAIELHGTSVYAFEGDKIIKEVKDYNQLGFLEQLGVVLETTNIKNMSAENIQTRGSSRYNR